MTDRSGEVVVVGAGVSGLTTALVLCAAGIPVRLYTRDLPAATTSCNAGAIWGPHMVEHPRIKRWSDATLRRLTGLAQRTAETGVRMVPGVEAAQEWTEQPEWMANLDHVEDARPEDLPPGWAVGWRYTVPIVDMPVYLAYLLAELARFGVRPETREIGSAAEMASLGDIVVNCTGLDSQVLLGDSALEPIRGDLVRVANPGVHEFFAEHTDRPVDQTYILPLGDYLLLGGTAYPGETSIAPDPDIARGVLERCAEIEPLLAGAEILEHRVGLRPSRTEVRVESERMLGSTVVHNYGHGGGGITLSWGCAEEVLSLVRVAGAGTPAADLRAWSVAAGEEVLDPVYQPVG